MNNGLGIKVSYLRVRFSFIAVIFGFFVFAVGAKPGWFGWDRSPVVGFVQIAVFLIGLAMICVGGMWVWLHYGGMTLAVLLQTLV